MNIKKFSVLLAAMLMVTGISGCAPAGDGGSDKNTENTDSEKLTAVISVEDFGDITLELYPDEAPESVRNFVYLARSGFYEGTVFHRISKGFVIQGGGFTTDGVQKPAKRIKGEFRENGIENNVKHERGVISWARTTVKDSATSQFFICLDAAATRSLDGAYAGFGCVTDGMDVVDAIAAVATSGETPMEDIVIKSVTVTGPELPEPNFLD